MRPGRPYGYETSRAKGGEGVSRGVGGKPSRVGGLSRKHSHPTHMRGGRCDSRGVEEWGSGEEEEDATEEGWGAQASHLSGGGKARGFRRCSSCGVYCHWRKRCCDATTMPDNAASASSAAAAPRASAAGVCAGPQAAGHKKRTRATNEATATQASTLASVTSPPPRPLAPPRQAASGGSAEEVFALASVVSSSSECGNACEGEDSMATHWCSCLLAADMLY
jgi:hypothetical protein